MDPASATRHLTWVTSLGLSPRWCDDGSKRAGQAVTTAFQVVERDRKATVSAETYELVVKGTFEPSLIAEIHGFRVDRTDQGLTYLVGDVPDQARLLGVLEALRDLTIPLVSVNPVPTGRPLAGDKTEGQNHG